MNRWVGFSPVPSSGIALAGLLALSGPITPPIDAGTRGADRFWLASAERDSGPQRFAYVLVRPEGRSGSGENRDFRDAGALGERIGTPFLWFRKGEVRYVVRDPGVIARLETILESREILERQQGQLGRNRGRLGDTQARLGRQQAGLGMRQDAVGMEQTRLSVEMARRTRHGPEGEDLSRRRDSLAREQDALGAARADLGKRQSRLGREQALLGAQQSVLGAQQQRLRLSIARKIEELADQAIESGQARRVSG